MNNPRTTNYQIPTINWLGYPVFTGKLDMLLALDKALINTINQYSYCVAEQDAEFKEALQKADVLLPDGVGVVATEKLLTGNSVKKIAGADLHQYLLEHLNEKGGRCFYLGSNESTLHKIRERLLKEYPAIKVQTYSPPYKPDFSYEDNKLMLEAVNGFKPDVLFVGMTAPKQEKWSFTQRNNLDARFICSIGAVFDFYAGTVKRPGKIWINMGLEWMGRLVNEPKRMSKRYLYYGFVFGYLICKEKAKQLYKNSNLKD